MEAQRQLGKYRGQVFRARPAEYRSVAESHLVAFHGDHIFCWDCSCGQAQQHFRVGAPVSARH